MFNQIYYNIVERGRQLKEDWCSGSGLHRHHIIPVHSGGNDEEDNFTYLSVREHIICHYLLWKIYNKPNDLRAMKMLGAKLTPNQRKITGEFCRDNGIGFHSSDYSEQDKSEWRIRGHNSQREEYLLDNKKNFYYWSTKEGRKERASLGGKTRSSREFNYWASKDGLLERASLGGKAHKGKRVMHFPGKKGWKRILPEEIDNRLNEGWKFGTGEPAPNSKIKKSF